MRIANYTEATMLNRNPNSSNKTAPVSELTEEILRKVKVTNLEDLPISWMSFVLEKQPN